MDEALSRYADIIKRDVGTDKACEAGAGAAGGLGFAFFSFLNTSVCPGITYILDALGIEKEIENADLLITGEGQLDAQTMMGKAPAGVAKIAKKHGVKTIAFAGRASDDAYKCNEEGIDAYFCIQQGPSSLQDAMDKDNAMKNMETTVKQVFRLIKRMNG